MRRQLKNVLLAAAIVTALTASSLWAQNAQAGAPPSPRQFPLQVAVTYNATLANALVSNSFWMQGGSVELEGRIYRGLGAVADVGGMNTGNINSTGVSLDLVTATFGPRYTWAPGREKYEFFGQGLAGVANGFNGLFPAPTGATTSQTSLAVEAGGGMNVALTLHVALRAFEVDYMRTGLPNSAVNVQNNVRFGAGMVFRFR